MNNDDYMRSAEEVAKEKDLAIFYPGPSELFVDIDDSDGLKQFYAAIPFIEKKIGTSEIIKRPSPSGRTDRCHIIVTLLRPVKDNFERISLQALLGSDRLHETLSWVRAVNGEQRPTVFFEKKPAQLTAKSEAA